MSGKIVPKLNHYIGWEYIQNSGFQYMKSGVILQNQFAILLVMYLCIYFIEQFPIMRNIRNPSNKHPIQLATSNSIVPTSRYRGFSKLYQLNLSKMLLRCHQSPFTNDDSNYQPQQTLVINTAQMLISVPQKNQHPKYPISKLSFKDKKTIHSEKNQLQRIFSNPTKISTQKKGSNNINKKDKGRQTLDGDKKNLQNLLKEQISVRLAESDGAKIIYSNGDRTIPQETNNQKCTNSQNLDSIKKQQKLLHVTSKLYSANKVKYLQKKSFSQNESKNHKKSEIKKGMLPNIKQNSQKFMNRKKDQQSKQEVKKSVPILTRDPEELKHIKSQSYAVYEHPTGNLVLSYRGNNPFEIASLTKIMTFYCVRKIQNIYHLNISQQTVVITDKSMDMGGTSAQILSNEIYTVEQLLYGLMLPSGNDAAVALAIWGGKQIFHHTNQPNKEDIIDCKQYQKRFIQEMNAICKQLQLSQTRFGNPHGLPHTDSRSTAVDVAILTSKCLEDEVFRNVVKTKNYKCIVQNNQTKTKRVVQWINTNKLLRRPGFIGIKTGITVTAGPCLASAYQFRDKVYIVVVLRCNKVSRRFKETRKLLAWSLSKMLGNSLTGQEIEKLKKLKRNNADLDSDYSEDERQFNFGKSDEAELKKRSNIIAYEM